MTSPEPPPHPDAPPTAPATFVPPQYPATPPAPRRGLYLLIGALGTLTLGAAVAIAAILADDPDKKAPAPAAVSPAPPAAAPPAPAAPLPANETAARVRNLAPAYCTPLGAYHTARVTNITANEQGYLITTDYTRANYGSADTGYAITECVGRILHINTPNLHGAAVVVTATGDQIATALF